MSKTMKERIILIGFSLTIILLLSIYVSYIVNLFKPYYKVEVNNNLLGYYLTENEYYMLYEQSCINTDNTLDINYFINDKPSFTSVYIKQKAVDQIDNMQLIKDNLEKTYNIYELIIDTEEKIYLATESQANLIKEEIQNNIKKATIKVNKIIVKDLSLLSTQEEIMQLKNKYIRVSKVTSRSGSRIAYRTAKQIVETEYNWPLINTGISSYYGSRTMNGTTKLHTGIDIPCSLNTDIEAVDNGTVIFAGWNSGYGYYIQIDHGAEIISAYAHLNSLSVNVGDNVIKRQIIGKSGSTGNSTGPHLHLEFIVNGNFYNPLTFYQDS